MHGSVRHNAAEESTLLLEQSSRFWGLSTSRNYLIICPSVRRRGGIGLSSRLVVLDVLFLLFNSMKSVGSAFHAPCCDSWSRLYSARSLSLGGLAGIYLQVKRVPLWRVGVRNDAQRPFTFDGASRHDI